jgi:lipopolysaccharide export system permease protein
MTVGVFTFVLLLVNGLKEILPYVVSGQVGIWTVLQALGYLVPWVWVFALPMGMLTATLLVFGRFSADQELTATRASGVSLLSLISPLLLLSLACCVLSALICMEVGPRCRVAYTNMFFRLKAELSNVQLPEDRFVRDFPGYLFYVGKKQGTNLEEVLVFELQNDTNVVRTIRARRGRLAEDRPNQQLILTLVDGSYIGAGDDVMNFEEMSVPLSLKKKGGNSASIEDMTFSQLREEMRALEKVDDPISRWAVKDREKAQATRKVWEERRKEMKTRLLFQMHRQMAFSFACFGFALIGIPLGIQVHRRETNIGLFIAMALAVVYYSLILLAQSMDRRPECAPYLIVWIPNLLFQTMGAVLLWRANRGV